MVLSGNECLTMLVGESIVGFILNGCSPISGVGHHIHWRGRLTSSAVQATTDVSTAPPGAATLPCQPAWPARAYTEPRASFRFLCLLYSAWSSMRTLSLPQPATRHRWKSGPIRRFGARFQWIDKLLRLIVIYLLQSMPLHLLFLYA